MRGEKRVAYSKQFRGYNIDEVFRIAVDESHCIIKKLTSKLKSNAREIFGIQV